jgi:uroporphyrinogen decarboxylase
MRQAGRYLPEYQKIRDQAGSFLNLCFTPELAAEVTLQPIRRFGFDAAILFADILLVPHALGQPLDFKAGEGPVLEAIHDYAAILKLGSAPPMEKLETVFSTVRAVRQQLDREIALIGFAGAPWTVAAYMVEGGSSRDFIRARRWALEAPESFAVLIQKLVDVTVDYLAGQVAAGADAVQLFESWAGVLPAEAFRRFCADPTAEIVRRLKAKFPGLPVIVFPRGAGLQLPGYAQSLGAGAIGADAIGLDAQTSPEWAAKNLQPRFAVQGNLDPAWLLIGGEGMGGAARSLLRALAGGPYIFNLGHGVLPQTPVEHVSELVEIVKSWDAAKSTGDN